MTANGEANGDSTIEALEVELDESDIPCAVLSPPFEGHTVPELKWWLLCRGIRPSAIRDRMLAAYAARPRMR